MGGLAEASRRPRPHGTALGPPGGPRAVRPRVRFPGGPAVSTVPPRPPTRRLSVGASATGPLCVALAARRVPVSRCPVPVRLFRPGAAPLRVSLSGLSAALPSVPAAPCVWRRVAVRGGHSAVGPHPGQAPAPTGALPGLPPFPGRFRPAPPPPRAPPRRRLAANVSHGFRPTLWPWPVCSRWRRRRRRWTAAAPSEVAGGVRAGPERRVGGSPDAPRPLRRRWRWWAPAGVCPLARAPSPGARATSLAVRGPEGGAVGRPCPRCGWAPGRVFLAPPPGAGGGSWGWGTRCPPSPTPAAHAAPPAHPPSLGTLGPHNRALPPRAADRALPTWLILPVAYACLKD